jgi:hypothetical protein
MSLDDGVTSVAFAIRHLESWLVTFSLGESKREIGGEDEEAIAIATTSSSLSSPSSSSE